MKLSRPWIVAPLTVVLGSAAAAQANVIPGLDLRLARMETLSSLGRVGVFPDGVNGVALETTICNTGTVEVEWRPPMNEGHPKIAFMIAALRNGRIEQLSNRSHVKHGFFALNGRLCGTCQPASVHGEYLGVGCSDTYVTGNNGSNFYLGPADEVNPWLGTWEPACSLFDRGYPDVGAPENCDGQRSLTQQGGSLLGPVNSRVQVTDEDFILGGDLFYQSQYIVEGIAEAGRDDVIGSQPFGAAWNGMRWILTPTGELLEGTVLQRWPNARLSSNTNGLDDGRVFVAVEVTGPVEGFYRYEYALHNRDNARGVGELRVPICADALVRNVGFRDLDRQPENDWTIEKRAEELAFTTGDSPLHWNTIFNFWFESDAAPEEAGLTLTAFAPGPGASEFIVSSQAPMLLMTRYLGPGCAFDTPPTLYPYGTPAIGRLGNSSFGLASSGNEPSQPNILYVGFGPGTRQFHGCTLWTGASSAVVLSAVMSDASGIARHPCPIPNLLALEGKVFRAQAVGRVPGNGPLLQDFELSDGLLVRLGNMVSACP